MGATFAANVEIGDKTWIGVGAIVSNYENIVSDCVIGAGAVAVKT